MNPETRDKAQAVMRQMYESVKAAWPAFQARPGQVAMMDAALAAFLNCREAAAPGHGENLALAEGPTGTGKTLSYLLAAAAASQVLNKTVVVSTATVALQEQLMLKDLPRLKECIGSKLEFQMLKGRQRYVCLQKLAYNVEVDADLFECFGDEAPSGTDHTAPSESASDKTSSIAGEMTKAFEQGTWDGDRDNWKQVVPEPLWWALAADTNSCTRRKCSQYGRCAFYEARKRASGAGIQVTNHALVLATLAVDANTIDPSTTLFVFDEGHHMPEIGLDQFTGEMRLHRTMRALAKTRAILPKAVALAKRESAWPNSVALAVETAKACEATLARLLADVLDDPAFAKAQQLRFEEGLLPEAWQRVVEQLSGDLAGVLSVATLATQDVLAFDQDDDPKAKDRAQALATEWAPWLAMLDAAQLLLKNWCSNDRVPLAKWLTVHPEAGDVTLAFSPLTAAKALSEHVWSRVSAAVVTSATLTACGSFDFFARLSGLNRYPMRTELVAPAVFDYKRQSRLCIPKLRTTPKDGQAFTAELIQVFPDLLKPFGAGQLCLFASRRQMEAVYQGLPVELQQSVLLQDSAPRSHLLADHRTRIGNGKPSILFGLQSLGEGIDLPGSLCEHVLIEKVPFAPPDSPVEAALSEWLAGQQRDAFAEVSVPKAGIRLAQWVGRAVRTLDDQAVITICDTRLRTARYGRRLLQGLPTMPSIQHPSEAGF